MNNLRVAFGADDNNEAVEQVKKYLGDKTEFVDLSDSGDWPDMSKAVANAVANKEADFGVLMCWTGTGTAIAANKVDGVRAAQATEAWIAENSRRWNDANVLTLSLKRTPADVCVECVEAFLAVDKPDSDELANIEKLC